MLHSLVSVGGRGPTMVALSSSMFSRAAPCYPSHASMWLCSSMSSVSRRGLLYSQPLPSIWASTTSEGGFTLFRRSHSAAQVQRGQYKLDTNVLEKTPVRPGKILYTYNSKKESAFFNIVAFVMFGAFSYGSYRIYISEDYEVTQDIPPGGDFPVIYKKYDLNPYRNPVAAGIFMSGLAFLVCTLRHSLRCVRSLVLLQDGETLAVSTYTLFGSTRTRNVPRLHLRTDKLNYLLDDYDSCFLIRRGQRISYILEHRGVIHDPIALKAAFAHSNDHSEVPPTERRV